MKKNYTEYTSVYNFGGGNVKTVSSSSNDTKTDWTVSLFVIVVMFLIIVALVRSTVVNGGPLTFTGFLNWLSNFKTIDIKSFLFLSDAEIKGDWTIFNFLRDFINVFINLGNVALFIVGGIVILIQFCVGLFGFLFAV